MHVCARTCRHSTSMEMWLHRVPRSEHSSWQLPFRLPACLDQTKELFLIIDAVIRLFGACCSAGWASPGVGWMESCYSTVDHLFSGFFLLPSTHPHTCCFTFPRNFPSASAEANPEGRRCTTSSRGASPCITGPDYCDMGVSAAPDLWVLGVCIR